MESVALGEDLGSGEKIDKAPDGEKLPLVCKKKMPPRIKRKKLDYPDETEGSRLAARIRRRANKMTSTQRDECLKKAMQIYYGGQPQEAARS